MREKYPPWGRRFTDYRGLAPWRTVHCLDFPYQVKTPDGSNFSVKPHAKPAGKSYWHGQRVKAGTFWSAKTSMTLRYRSFRERLWLEALESDPTVVHYYVEPVRIRYTVDNRNHWYVPDLLIQYVDGRKVIAEVKLEVDAVTPLNQAKFQAARDWCWDNGMVFEVRVHLP